MIHYLYCSYCQNLSLWIKLKFEKQIWENIIPFNPDENKHAQEVTFSMTMAQSYHLHICFNYILGIYLNDKLNFYYDMLAKNVQIKEKNRYH